MDFESWYAEVDRQFNELIGLSRDCFPDQLYWDMWDAGDTPREAVITAVENEYGDAGLEAFGLEN